MGRHGNRVASFALGLLVGLLGGSLVLVWSTHAVPSPSAPAAASVLRPELGLPLAGEQMQYRLSWQGVSVLTLQVAVRRAVLQGKPSLELTYRIEPSRPLRAVKPFLIVGATLMDRRSLTPTVSERTTSRRGRVKRTVTRFDARSGIARTTKWRSGRRKATEQRRLRGAVEAASALLLLRSARLAPGRPRSLAVLEGGHLYRVVLSARSRRKVEVRAGRFEAIEAEALVRQEDGEPEAAKACHRALLWLAEGSRVPLMLRADLPVGHLEAELVGYRPGSAD